MFVVLGGGYISQRLKKAGVSSRLSRGAFASATVILGGGILPFVGSMPTPELKLALVVVGGAIGSTIYVVIPMIVSELTPQPQRAGMLAITTSVVTLAGVSRRSSWARWCRTPPRRCWVTSRAMSSWAAC